MPELPDVETFKRYIDSTSLHKRIEQAKVLNDAILDEVSSREVEEALEGHELTETRRHGKYLFVCIDNGPWLVLHFGMTGRVAYFKARDETPQHTRLLLSFDNGYHLAFVCQRMFGRVSLTPESTAFVKDKDLGPDARDLTSRELASRLQGSRGSAKSALMDQSLLAGIGNVYSDEILFQAGINPRTRVARLSKGEMDRMGEAAHEVLDTAIEKQATPERFPSSFLTPHRGKGGRCPRCGGELAKVSVSGRSAYYCPKCQPTRD